MSTTDRTQPTDITEALRLALATSRQSGRPLIEVLSGALASPPRNTLAILGEHFQIPLIDTAGMNTFSPDFDRLPLARAQRRRAVLLCSNDVRYPTPTAVICDPLDTDLRAWLDSLNTTPPVYRLALPEDLDAYLSGQEASIRAVENILQEAGTHTESDSTTEVLNLATINEAASPAVKLVNSTLYDALKIAASDIHLESTPGGLTIKYRIDGVLDHGGDIGGNALAEQVISRLKVLSELDIAERRVPQDGSFRVRYGNRDIDLRVSIMPSVHGEDAVIRILDKRSMVAESGRLTLESLGFNAEALATLRELAGMPYGMLLVTGPTGSGKTTTLYGAIAEINNGRDKIVTIEDPVEYQLPGVLQIPVNDKKGLTFARGLRSILRHDPDKIMVGEIRDKDTAEIAVQSALTGHLVLTTVHANNVFDVFGRFTHMGIDPYAFASALNGIWAQRLVRIVCRHCAEAYTPNAIELQHAGLAPEDTGQWHFQRGRGCGDCRGTGFRGRKAVAEILLLNDELREMIVEKQPIRRIKEAARQNGTRSLRVAALELVARGETTLDEVRRVTLSA